MLSEPTPSLLNWRLWGVCLAICFCSPPGDSETHWKLITNVPVSLMPKANGQSHSHSIDFQMETSLWSVVHLLVNSKLETTREKWFLKAQFFLLRNTYELRSQQISQMTHTYYGLCDCFSYCKWLSFSYKRQ